MNKIQFQGRTIFHEVSPCSWMNPGYGLQVKISLVANGCNAESKFVNDKSIPAAQMKREALDEAGEALALRWLNENGLAPLDEACERWAKAQAEFAVESARDQEKEERRQATMDKKMKAKGFTHRIDGWVHPTGGGDDRMFQAYSEGKPTDDQIQKKFLSRSSVKNDYRVIAL